MIDGRTGSPEILQGEIFYADGSTNSFEYHPTYSDYMMMDLALKEAAVAKDQDDSPIGAALVNFRDVRPLDTVVTASAREHRDKDVLSHAEVNVYKKVQGELGRDLSGCALYTTAEPCIMCTYLSYRAGVETLFIAANRSDSPDFFRQKDVDMRKILTSSARTMVVVSGLRRASAVALLTKESRKR